MLTIIKLIFFTAVTLIFCIGGAGLAYCFFLQPLVMWFKCRRWIKTEAFVVNSYLDIDTAEGDSRLLLTFRYKWQGKNISVINIIFLNTKFTI